MVAVIKVTKDGKEMYLQSFRYADQREIEKLRKDGNLVELELMTADA